MTESRSICRHGAVHPPRTSSSHCRAYLSFCTLPMSVRLCEFSSLCCLRSWAPDSIYFAHLCPCFHALIHSCVCVHASNNVFPRYLQYPLMDFCSTFVIGASWDKKRTDYKVIRSKVKVTLSRRMRLALDALVEFSFLVGAVICLQFESAYKVTFSLHVYCL